MKILVVVLAALIWRAPLPLQAQGVSYRVNRGLRNTIYLTRRTPGEINGIGVGSLKPLAGMRLPQSPYLRGCYPRGYRKVYNLSAIGEMRRRERYSRSRGGGSLSR